MGEAFMKTAFLIVDDEAIVLLALKRELAFRYEKRFRIETALSAEEGLDVMNELIEEGVEVVLIISDWLMPGMKGDEFLVRVKQNTPKVITIMLTGHADMEAVERARREGGVAACFTKPWKSIDLYKTIETELIQAGHDPVVQVS
jgi:DNA-binding NtrC family response regulator